MENSIDELIILAINNLTKYKNINKFIKLEEAKKKWLKWDKNNEDINLFYLSIQEVWKSKNIKIKKLLNNLDKYLELLNDRDDRVISDYSNKLLNLQTNQFHSTLSELFIAKFYLSQNYELKFFYNFKKFNKKSKDHDPDFDFLVFNHNTNYTIEVYMPVYGYEDFIDYVGPMPHGFNYNTKRFAQNIEQKITRKLGVGQQVIIPPQVEFLDFAICFTFENLILDYSFESDHLKITLTELLKPIKQKYPIIRYINLFYINFEDDKIALFMQL